MMQRTITVTVEPTPEELAFCFSNLFNDGQASVLIEAEKSPLLSAQEYSEVWETSRQQAEIEIERLKAELETERKISTDLQGRIELAYDTARQHAAREIIEIMGGWPLKNATLIDLRGRVARHFGLGGGYE